MNRIPVRDLQIEQLACLLPEVRELADLAMAFVDVDFEIHDIRNTDEAHKFPMLRAKRKKALNDLRAAVGDYERKLSALHRRGEL